MGKQVVVIGQDDPGACLHPVGDELLKEGIKDLPAATLGSHVADMLVARHRQQIERLVAQGMRWRVRGIAMGQTLLHEFGTLFWREFAVFVHGLLPVGLAPRA